MNKAIALILAVALMVGRNAKTEYGPCVGLLEDGRPELTYRLDVWNVVVAMALAETMVVPAVWFFSFANCPTGRREVTP